MLWRGSLTPVGGMKAVLGGSKTLHVKVGQFVLIEI